MFATMKMKVKVAGREMTARRNLAVSGSACARWRDGSGGRCGATGVPHIMQRLSPAPTSAPQWRHTPVRPAPDPVD